MLRSILLKMLRDQRWPVLAWGSGIAIYVIVNAFGWARAYPDEASRQQFAQQIASGLSATQLLYGEPHNVDQLGGYLGWRAFGVIPVLLGLFIVIAATGVTRGAEERGETAVVLSAGQSRGAMFVQQAAGLLLALGAICALIWLSLLPAGRLADVAALNLGRTAFEVLNGGLVGAMFGGFALLAAQFARTRRAAALTAGILMFAAYIWNNLGLIASGIAGARAISPMHLYSRSTPLATGHVDGAAMAAMAAIALGCAALAGWLFTRRDLGEVVRLPLPSLPARLTAPRAAATWLLRSPLERAVRSSLGAALAWGLALAAYAALITALAPGVRAALEEQSASQDFINRLQRGGVSTETAFLALALSTLVTAMIAIFAITLPIGWSSEERSGQLELDLTAPVPRGRYFVARVGAALLTSAVVVALVGGALLVAAWRAGVDLSWGRALVAVLLLLPLAGVFIAFGFAVSAWRPGPVAAILSAALAISYLLDLLTPLLDLPSALRDLSVFHMYGQPLTEGVSWGGLAAMLALIAVFSFTGSRLFARRDIAK